MHYIYLCIDVILMAGIAWGVSRKRNTLLGIICGLAYMTVSVYFGYRNQENSDLFFWHPFIVWSLINIGAGIIALRGKQSDGKTFVLNRLVLGEIVLVPVLAGFTLCVGWLMKLYIR